MDALDLIARSQSGDELAMNALLSHIKQQHMPSRIRRFVQRNVLISKDEIESEFLSGCWQAIYKAKLDIGNPVMFICWKGTLSVIHLFRAKLSDGVRINCPNCGIGSLRYVARKKTPICHKCGSTDVSTFMVVTDESQADNQMHFESDVETHLWDKIDASQVEGINQRLFNDVTYEIQIDEIRAKLNGRVLQLFDIMVLEGINRDTSQNYLEEIACRWGVSTACVSVYLRKLRLKLNDIRVKDAA